VVVGVPVLAFFLFGTPELDLPSQWADVAGRRLPGYVVDIIAGLLLLAWVGGWVLLVVMLLRRDAAGGDVEAAVAGASGLESATVKGAFEPAPGVAAGAAGGDQTDEPWYRQGPPIFDEPFRDDYPPVAAPPDDHYPPVAAPPDDQPPVAMPPDDQPPVAAPPDDHYPPVAMPADDYPPVAMPPDDHYPPVAMPADDSTPGDSPVESVWPAGAVADAAGFPHDMPPPDPVADDGIAGAESFGEPAAPSAEEPPMIVPVRAYYFTRAEDTLRSVAAQFLQTPRRWEELRSLNAASPGVAGTGPDALLPVGTALALPGDPLPWGKPDPVYLWTLAEKFLFTAWGREPTPEEVAPFWRGLTSGRQIGPPMAAPPPHLAPPQVEVSAASPASPHESAVPADIADPSGTHDSLVDHDSLVGGTEPTPAAPPADEPSPAHDDVTPPAQQAPEAPLPGDYPVPPDHQPPATPTPYESPVPPAHQPPPPAAPGSGLPDPGGPAPEARHPEAEAPRMPSFMPSLTGTESAASTAEAEVVSSATRSLAGTAVGDAMMLWQLSRLRRGRDRPDGRDPVEESLRQGARTDTLDLIEAAMRQLRAVTVGQLREKPAVLAVRVGTYGFEVLLSRPIQAPDGWRSASGGYVLELPQGTTVEDLAGAAQGPTLCAALVPVGDTLEGPLLLNIEEIGCLIVSGPGSPSVRLLNAVVGTLGSSPLAGDIRIITVGLDTPVGLPGWDRVHSTSFDSEELEDLLSTAAAGSGTFLDVLVVGPGNDLLIQRVGQLSTTPGSRLALVGATSSAAARWPWRVHVDETAVAVVHPIACTMAAAQAAAPAMSQLLSEVTDPSLIAPPRF